MVALAGAGLFIRSMREAENVQPGFETKNVFAFRLDLASRHYTQERGREFLRQMVQQAQNTPGVTNAAISSAPPTFGGFLGTTFPEGQEDKQKVGGLLVAYNSHFAVLF